MKLFENKKKPCAGCEACKDAIWSVYVKNSKLTEFQIFYIKQVLIEIGEMTDTQSQLIIQNLQNKSSALIYGSNDKRKLLYVVGDLLCEGVNVMITTNKL